MGIANEATKGCLGGCLGVGLAVIILLGIVISISTHEQLTRTPEQRAADTAKSDEQKLSVAAQGRAKDFVLKYLKSPKTADFPFLDWKVTPLGDSRFSVTSYVDSQNSFGANIRTDFNVILRYKGGPTYLLQNWKIEQFSHNP